MLSVTTGYDTGYLTGAVGGGREGYYTAATVDAGEPPGVWYGAGAEALGLAGEVDPDLLEAVYAHGLDPRDAATHDRASWGEAEAYGPAPRRYRSAEEIYAAKLQAEPDASAERQAELRAQAERSARQSVAFYDCTFSAPKSVSVAWAACERASNEARAAGDTDAAGRWAAMAQAVDAAILAGARGSIDYLQARAAYARVGHHGGGAGRWVDVLGLTVAQFQQHDSRDRDPQGHVHQAVSNRVLCPNEVVRSLDSRSLFRARGAAGAVGERIMEAQLSADMGVRWVARPDGHGREIEGVGDGICELTSSRRRAITPKVREAAAAFEARVGRAPNKLELSALAGAVTLATRRAKSHHGESREQMVARVDAACRAELGASLAQVAHDLAVIAVATADLGPEDWSQRDVFDRAAATLAETKAAWTRHDAVRAISDALPANLGLRPEEIIGFFDRVTEEFLAAHAVRLSVVEDTAGLSAELLRADGTSQYEAPASVLYATADQLAAEQRLRAAAVERGRHAFTADEADALVDRYTHAGRPLAADQAAAVRGVLTSGAAVEVLSAAAGTGKSYTVGVLAEAWQDGSERRVFGLATSQIAAQVLAEEGVTAMNTARWLATQDRLTAGTAAGQDADYQLQAGDLVVVDEAGMSATAELHAIAQRCEHAGAKLLLTGDPRQLAAVGAGGAMADIGEHGIRYELAEVRRFDAAWERDASLRLREGDPAAVAEYTKRGRVIDAGSAEQAETAAARAWLADTLAGREALLLVGSNEAAARLSAALRAELVALGRVEEAGVPLGRQGTVAGVGDVVAARRNAWWLDGTPINRETFRVLGADADGSLTVVRPDHPDESLRLPAGYVAEYVELAYASTVHAAQGRTVDVGHAVVGAGSDSAGVYVAFTRGRQSNTAWTITRAAGEDAATGEVHQSQPRAARAVLEQALARQQQPAERTGLAEAEASAATARSIATHVDRLTAEIAEATAGRTGQVLDRLTAEGAITEAQRHCLAADEAYGTLQRLLRTAELAGHNPDQVLTEAVTSRPLDGARSPAQVLHRRILDQCRGRLTPEVGSFADLIPANLPEDRRQRLSGLADAAEERRRELGAQTAEDVPGWTRDALGPVPEDATERAGWEHRASWAAAYRELADHHDTDAPLGAAPPEGLAENKAVWRAAHRELDLPEGGAEEGDLSTGQLRARVRALAREEAWAPSYVADELSATLREAQHERTNATIWAARAEATTDQAEAAQLREAADRAQARHRELAQQADQLDTVDEARAAWYAHTAVTRDKAERARAALEERSVDLDTEDRTTADEWMAAHREDQAEEEQTRPITDEAELAELWPAVSIDEDAAETVHPDARQTAPAAAAPAANTDQQPDEHAGQRSEQKTHQHQHRVPTAQQSTAATEKAARAMAEIRARAAEEARITAEENASREAANVAHREHADAAATAVADDDADTFVR